MKKKRNASHRASGVIRALPVVILSAGLWAGADAASAETGAATIAEPVKNIDLAWAKSSPSDTDPLKAVIAVAGAELRIDTALHRDWLPDSDAVLAAASQDLSVVSASFDGRVLVLTVNGAGAADIVLTATASGETLTDTIRINTVKIGDTTGDGLVTSADALYITKVATGKVIVTSPEELNALDINRDGAVTAADATLLLSKYVNKTASSAADTYIVSLRSVNDAPVAQQVVVSGPSAAGGGLTATVGYRYRDAEGDAEGASQVQWYRGHAADGSDMTEIAGAHGLEYVLAPSDEGYYLFAKVTPLALTGTLEGASVVSASGVLAPDMTAPAVTEVALPAAGSYKAGARLKFTVTMSEPVFVAGTGTGTPALSFTTSAGGRQAAFSAAESAGDRLVFEYTVADGDTASAGLSIGAISLAGGTVKDAAGNDAVLSFAAPSGSAIVIDTTAPAVSGTDLPAAKTYKLGDKLTFAVNLNEAVALSGGEPSLALDIGGVARQAAYRSDAGSATRLVFEYTLADGDLDADGIEIGAIGLPSGAAIRDAAGNDASLSLGTLSSAGIKVDAVAPKSGDSHAPADGLYKAGDTLAFGLDLDEPVTVNGAPGLTLRVGNEDRTAVYDAAHSSPTHLAFAYTIRPDDLDADGIVAGAIALNSATIADAAGNAAALDYEPGDLSGIRVDGIAPAALTLTPEAAASGVAPASPLELTFSEAVMAVTGKQIKLVDDKTNATVATYDAADSANVQITGSKAIIVNPGLSDSSSYRIEIEAGAFADAAGNSFAGLSGAAWTFSTPDLTAPIVQSLSPQNGGTLADPSADWVLTFSEPVQLADASKMVMIRQTSDGSLVASYTADESGKVEIDGDQLKIKPPALDENTSYYVEIEPGAYADLAGNAFTGMSGSAAWSFSTSPPVVPTLTGMSFDEFSEPKMALDQGAIVELTLTDDKFKDDIRPSYLLLNHAPPGMTLIDVTWIDDTHVWVALDYDGTDFDTDVTNFSITVAGIGVESGHPITSADMTIQAEVEPALRSFVSEYWYNGGTGVAIELHNPGGAQESGLTMDIYTAQSSTSYTLGGINLTPGAVYVVIDNRFESFMEISHAAYFNDSIILAPSSNFNSIPVVTAIVLKKNGVVIDKVGDPSGSTPLLTAGHSMRRKSGTSHGAPTYHDYQWNFVADTGGSGITHFP